MKEADNEPEAGNSGERTYHQVSRFVCGLATIHKVLIKHLPVWSKVETMNRTLCSGEDYATGAMVWS